MDRIREDAQCLINPTFEPKESEQDMHSATKEAIETVKTKLADLTKTYQELMTICQQKRDLFIVCVKFHMTNRQVCGVWSVGVLARECVWVGGGVCLCAVEDEVWM